MDEEYQALESTSRTFELGEVTAPGYEMDFSCLDLVVSAQTLALRHNNLTLLILWQAESRDFDELKLVFLAITMSLWQSHDAG
jgi:hypothetical protein